MKFELECKIIEFEAEPLRKLLILGKYPVGTLLRHVLAVKGSYLFTAVKTCLIGARQRIFSRYLVYKHPSLEGGTQATSMARRSSANKRSRQMISPRASQKLRKS